MKWIVLDCFRGRMVWLSGCEFLVVGSWQMGDAGGRKEVSRGLLW